MLELTTPFMVPSAPDLVQTLLALCSSQGQRVGDALINGRRLGKKMPETLLGGRSWFRFSAADLSARCTPIANYDHTLIVVNCPQAQEGECAEFLVRSVPVVTARVYADEYDTWQNAADVGIYLAAGRSVEGLPMKDNGAPPPLRRMIVDTSQNPGRRVLRSGYVEAIGHRMWLGAEYFRRVPGASRDAVDSADWLTSHELPNGVIEVVVGSEPFGDVSTAPTQERLRMLLFPPRA